MTAPLTPWTPAATDGQQHTDQQHQQAVLPGHTRRRFLLASGIVGAAGLAAGAVTLSRAHGAAVLGHAATTRPLTPGTGVVVLVTLYGGNDALGMVAPVGDPAYAKARGDLALTGTLPLADGLALHPSMTRLKKQWDAQRLAVVRGVGYPQQDHSHFRSMAIWQTGSPTTSVPTGWVGRWLDAQAAAHGADPLRAVAVGPTVPPLLAGATTVGACVPVGPMVLPSGVFGAGTAALGAATYADPLQQAVATSLADLGTVAAKVTAALEAVPVADAGGTSLDGGAGPSASPSATKRTVAAQLGGDLGAQLDVVARCIKAGVPTRVWSVSLGGFDTHSGEKQTQDTLLAELDAALGRFLGDVDGSPHAAGLVVQVSSEFGRRVTPNASGGTDHGTSAPVLVLGPGVKGGLYGEQPSLTDLTSGDLKTTTDFRDVYATVLTKALGADPAEVFPGEARNALTFL